MDAREARNWLWLESQAAGFPAARIAAAWGVSPRRIQAGIREARGQLDACIQNRPLLSPPRLVVFYGCTPFTPQSTCNHDLVEIPEGDPFCCGICHRSGRDDHPALRRDARTDPEPARRGRPPAMTPASHQRRRTP